MPFYRRDDGAGGKAPDRTQTGGLRPPEPGQAQTEEGTIVGSLTDPAAIPAGTEVKVTLPGPREALFDAGGNMSPRWYRFFQELYRRTGGTNDNVNFVPSFRKISNTTGSLALTGYAPTVLVDHYPSPSAGSLTLTGYAPT